MRIVELQSRELTKVYMKFRDFVREEDSKER